MMMLLLLLLLKASVTTLFPGNARADRLKYHCFDKI